MIIKDDNRDERRNMMKRSLDIYKLTLNIIFKY